MFINTIEQFFKIIGCILLMSATSAIAQELIPPENYGGKRELNELVKLEMIYPEKAYKQKVQGKVNIHFHVDESGNVSMAEVTESPDPSLSEEAIRIFGKLLWDPSIYRGAAREAEHNTEIIFKTGKYKKAVRYRGYDKIQYLHIPYDTTNRVFEFNKLSEEPRPFYNDKAVDLGLFIAQNMKYPDVALKKSISGKVRIFFVIEPYGGVTNAKIVEHLGAGCCEEAMRLIRKIDWIPGKAGKNYVRTAMTVDVSFRLSESTEYNYFPTYHNNAVE